METPQRIFSRREVEGRIAAGDTLVIKENMLLRLNAWKDKHPGGDIVIQHMVGRDATDEINISHPLHIVPNMRRFCIGQIERPWRNFIPPIQGGSFRACNEDGDDGDEEEEKEDNSILRADAAAKIAQHASVNSLLSPEGYTISQVQHDIAVDLAKYPSLDAETQRNIALRFQALHQRVRDEGFYICRYSEYGKEMLRYIGLFALFAFFLHRGNYFVSACFLGFFWHQIMFSAHDAGHRGITQNLTADTLIGIFIANVCCGLSIGWWKSSHNVHHLVTNLPEHDPDIQNVPLFATSPSFFSSLKSSYYGGVCFPWDAFASVAILIQKYTYYPVMLVARFNLYFLSWLHLLSPRSHTKGSTWWTRPAEIAGILLYAVLSYILLFRFIPTWWSRIVFVLASHIATGPIHVQITLSHWGTSTSDLGPVESFAQKQLRTTMDVDCPAWLDFFHGGLQFQAVHHLFPRVPRHNLRRLQALVKEFCAETGIEHLSHGFTDGNTIVLGKLGQISNQARMLAACQAHMIAEGESLQLGGLQIVQAPIL